MVPKDQHYIGLIGRLRAFHTQLDLDPEHKAFKEPKVFKEVAEYRVSKDFWVFKVSKAFRVFKEDKESKELAVHRVCKEYKDYGDLLAPQEILVL
jgi:hypothetical protein